jgi:hypothetical protein
MTMNGTSRDITNTSCRCVSLRPGKDAVTPGEHARIARAGGHVDRRTGAMRRSSDRVRALRSGGWRRLRRDQDDVDRVDGRDRSNLLDGRNDGRGDVDVRSVRRARTGTKQARNCAVLVARSTTTIDRDEVRLTATIVLADANVVYLELLAVLRTRDVPRLGFVLQRDELADDKQRNRECSGRGWSATHAPTIAQVQPSCAASVVLERYARARSCEQSGSAATDCDAGLIRRVVCAKC